MANRIVTLLAGRARRAQVNNNFNHSKGDVTPLDASGNEEDNVHSLGSSVFRWLNGFFSGTVTMGKALIDNLSLDGNTLSSTDVDGNVNITPNGNGNTVINGQNFNVDANGDAAVNDVVAGGEVISNGKATSDAGRS